MDDELKGFLSGIYQILRTLSTGLAQQQVLTKALLETIRENPDFAVAFQNHYKAASTGPLSQSDAATLSLIDEILRQLGEGEN